MNAPHWRRAALARPVVHEVQPVEAVRIEDHDVVYRDTEQRLDGILDQGGPGVGGPGIQAPVTVAELVEVGQ